MQSVTRHTVPLIIIAFCVFAIWQTTMFDRVPPILKRGIQPSDFPQLIAGLMIALSVILWIWPEAEPEERLSPNCWATLALMLGFVLVMPVDLFLALGLFGAALALFWGERRIWALGLVGLVIPACVFLLFDLVFRIRFPRGVLTSLWYG